MQATFTITGTVRNVTMYNNGKTPSAQLGLPLDEYDGKDLAGQTQYKTVWHNITGWGATAEAIDRNIFNGSIITATCRVTYGDNGKCFFNIVNIDFIANFGAANKAKWMKKQPGERVA